MHGSLWLLVRNGCALLFFLLFVIASAVHAAKGETTLVSVSSEGTIGDGASSWPSISSDGRYVAFRSYAENLVDDDTNDYSDIFVHDRQTGETTRVSVAPDGITEGDGSSSEPSISSDGRYVAFSSYAHNLVAGDTNGQSDIFVHDRQTGETTRVSVASGVDGAQGNAYSSSPHISSDGRYVAFSSDATNLVDGDTNSRTDIFVHDRQTLQTTRVSVRSGVDGTQSNGHSYFHNYSNPAISSDGRYVAFYSFATNLVDDDTNGVADTFVHDCQTGETTRVSIGFDGEANGPSLDASISSDGRYVAFSSEATNLVEDDTNGVLDIFVHDRQTLQTTRVSVASDGTEGDDDSYGQSISSDGRYVAFGSEATNLVDGDTNVDHDVFVHDRQTGQTTRVSVGSDGSGGDYGGWFFSISSDGRYVAFGSDATLVDGDTNGVYDIFVHDYLGPKRSGGGGGCSLNPQGTLGLEWLLLALFLSLVIIRRVVR
jgi:Tol biopolymer transport system component